MSEVSSGYDLCQLTRNPCRVPARVAPPQDPERPELRCPKACLTFVGDPGCERCPVRQVLAGAADCGLPERNPGYQRPRTPLPLPRVGAGEGMGSGRGASGHHAKTGPRPLHRESFKLLLRGCEEIPQRRDVQLRTVPLPGGCTDRGQGGGDQILGEASFHRSCGQHRGRDVRHEETSSGISSPPIVPLERGHF
jgi:hypothetical protein